MAPTIVLVPSSFCSASLTWNAVVDALFSAGHHDVVAVDLPSVSPPSSLPGKNMTDDANHIRGVIEAIANKGREVVLVMHSYGGIPGTQSLSGVTRGERRNAAGGNDKGKEGTGVGGVVRLVYVSSLLVREGENSDDSLKPFKRQADLFRVEVCGFFSSQIFLNHYPTTRAPGLSPYSLLRRTNKEVREAKASTLCATRFVIEEQESISK